MVKRLKGIGWRIIFFPAMMIYLEYYFHTAVYNEIDAGVLYPLVWGAAVGMLLAMLTCIFKNKGNIVISYLIAATVTLLYIAQMLYHDIFATFFSLTSIRGAKNALDFKSELSRAVRRCLQYEIGMLIPLLLFILFGIFIISFERPGRKQNICGAGGAAIAFFAAVLSLNIGGREPFTPYSLYHGNFVMELSMHRLGVAVTTGKDALAILFQDNKSVDICEFNGACITEDDVNEEGYSPQIDENIDLQALYDNAEDEDIKNITAYVSNQTPTYENRYTGMFEGYNLVYITAESLCRYVVREDWTPALYKIMNEGFVFDNYYNPSWYKSTIDGEFVNCLSQYPSFSRWSLQESADTYQPYALGNAMSGLGYTGKAYHDYNSYYYDRSETHPNLGYDFKAIGLGLELPSQDIYFSDLEMMQVVYEDFSKDEPFNVYFMTYSGHLPYDYGDNPIAEKNREQAERLTEGLPYNDTVRAYIAAQLELEYALEYLIDRLERDGLLEETLFVVTPDHIPVALESEDYDALAGDAVSDNKFERYRSCLGIWNVNMEEPIEVGKLCASIDILPTILNLMGVNYDSRLLAGRDILYDEPGCVMLSDYSYMSGDICYDVYEGEVLYSAWADEEDTSNAVYDIINTIGQKYYISDKIIERDYYRYVYGK